MISWGDLAPWAAFVLSVAVFLRSEFNGRSKALDNRIGIIVADVSLVKDRVTSIESDLKHLPDQKTVNKLEGMIGTLSKVVGMLSERIKPIAAMADRIQEAIVEKVMS